MNPKRVIITLFCLAFFLASCEFPAATTATPEVKGPIETATTAYIIVTNTPVEVPLATATLASLPTSAPAATATMAPETLPDYSSTAYLDDRSTAAALILSYANAINRFEYLRAYSYWTNPGSYLGLLDTFNASWSDVASVSVAMGTVTTEGAAGSSYFTIPAAETDHLSGGGSNKYAVCYVLRFPQPGNYGAPPIQPMHFDQYTRVPVSASMSDADAIGLACSGGSAGLPGAVAAVEGLDDISAGNYIDNRSGAVEVIKSLLNAINRKEYVRAYSYWENPSVQPGSYAAYANGFSDTASVTAVFGNVISDAGAGQFHYQVPVGEVVTTTANATQTFIGCYTLHLANPGMQGTLPFKPLAITNGSMHQVANGTNLTPLLATACN